MEHDQFTRHRNQNHIAVHELWDKLSKTGKRDFMQRESLFSDLRREVRMHLVAERDSVYRALSEYPVTRDLGLQARDDIEKQLDNIEEINDMSAQAEVWLSQVESWVRSYNRFCEWEDSVLPQAIDTSLPGERLEAVEQMYTTYRSRERDELDQEKTFPF